MTDKKDGSGQKDGQPKSSDRPATDNASGKRPFATIDLKAVEVPLAPSKTGPVPPEAAAARDDKSASAPQAEAAARVVAANQALGQSSAQPGKSGSVPASGSKPAASTSSKNGASTISSAPSGSGATPPAGPPRGSAFGRLLTHTLAGVVGGAVAIFAAPSLMPVLRDAGLPVPPPAVSPELQSRLAALERAQSAPVEPARDPARAVTQSEANRQRLEALARDLASVTEAQARVGKVADDLKAFISREPPIADAAARLVGLEKQLQTIQGLAGAEGDRGGRVPQIAQLVGRIADLEAAAATRAAELRKELLREVDARVAPSTEASEASRATSQRVDREVAGLKTESTRIATGLDQVKTLVERQQLGLKSVQDEAAQLGTSLEAARRDLDQRIRSLAKPADISAAVAPLAGQVTSLEKNLSTVVKSESERNATAERIVLALELGNLKRAMERGTSYAAELAEVRRIAGDRLDLAALDRYRDKGVATQAALVQELRPVANAILDAEVEKTDGSVVDRLLSGAKSFVRVRRTTTDTNDRSPEAVVARMETALKAGRLADVLKEAKSLERQPPIAKDWLAKVEARQIVDAALTGIDAALKASLGTSATTDGSKRSPQ